MDFERFVKTILMCKDFLIGNKFLFIGGLNVTVTHYCFVTDTNMKSLTGHWLHSPHSRNRKHGSNPHSPDSLSGAFLQQLCSVQVLLRIRIPFPPHVFVHVDHFAQFVQQDCPVCPIIDFIGFSIGSTVRTTTGWMLTWHFGMSQCSQRTFGSVV